MEQPTSIKDHPELVTGIELMKPTFSGRFLILGKGEDIVVGKKDGGCFFDGMIDEVRIWDQALSSGEILESFWLGEAGNNPNYDTILSHEAGSSVFIFTSAFHDVDDDDTIAFRLMRVDSAAAIDTAVSDNGISIRRVTPEGSTWTLDSVVSGDPVATERDIDPGMPGGPRPHQTLHLHCRRNR